LQINNWFDFAILSLFLLGLVLIGLPFSIYLLYKGIIGFVNYKLKKLPSNFFRFPGIGNYSFEVIFYGLFLLVGIIWIIFFDKGGHLFSLIHEINDLISTK